MFFVIRSKIVDKTSLLLSELTLRNTKKHVSLHVQFGGS